MKPQEVKSVSNILICDDEKDIVSALKIYLEAEGYQTFPAYNGKEALAVLDKEDIHLVLLDVMMPGLDGIGVLAKLREWSNVPVILLTAKSEDTDKVLGLNLGADDYITKPFDILERVERVNAVLRRARKTEDVVSFGDVTADFSKRRVLKGGEEVHLKPKEFDLLEALVVNRNLALSREKLIELVWPMDFDGDERTVDIHVRRLRQKLGLEDRLITVFKTGYRLQI